VLTAWRVAIRITAKAGHRSQWLCNSALHAEFGGRISRGVEADNVTPMCPSGILTDHRAITAIRIDLTIIAELGYAPGAEIANHVHNSFGRCT
jgi:hypothetical protein